MNAVPDPLLSVRDLHVRFRRFEAVRGISFSLRPGEIRAVVGESGSGKSVTSLALTGLLPRPPECTVTGSVKFAGVELASMSRRQLRRLRGKDVAYIFQEPSAALNPVFTIGRQLVETVRLHRPEIRNPRSEVISALERVGIREPDRRFDAFPGEFSGGMLQRVMIALALLARPRLLVADEPTTALDVTIERQIIDLLREVQAETGMGILLITHNFGIVRGFAETVQVMWRGKIVESGPVPAVLDTPRHPYTRALIACIPRLGDRRTRLPSINDFELLAANGTAATEGFTQDG